MDVHSSRAYLKCCDILARFPALKQRRQGFAKLQILHLCEAPVSFVAALGDSLGEDELGSWAWRINSLNPHHEWNDPSGMLTEDALLLAAEMAEKALYVAEDTGDVFRLTKANLEAVGKMDLVSADGSIDCTANPEVQLESVGPLISREAFLACSALEAGGNLVLKLFTFFREPTQDIVCRLIGSFDEVYFRNPSPSKPGNSEVYAVCLGFKGTVILDKSEVTLRSVPLPLTSPSAKSLQSTSTCVQSKLHSTSDAGPTASKSPLPPAFFKKCLNRPFGTDSPSRSRFCRIVRPSSIHGSFRCRRSVHGRKLTPISADCFDSEGYPEPSAAN